MNRNRLLVIGIFAVIIAGVVSFKIFTMVKRSMTSASAAGTRVVVAARDLNVGQQLTVDDLKTIVLPETQLPKGASNDPAKLFGRGVILPVAENEVLLESKISSSKGAGLPPMITPGMRAVSVKVNDVVSVAGFVAPGTRVDVIVTGTPNDKSGLPNVTTTTTVLQNILVLAAGKEVKTDPRGKPQDVPVITLLVSPEDAQLLTLASSEGRIQLSLRNPTDVDKATTTPVRDAAIYGGVPVTPPAAQGRRPRKMLPAVARPAIVESYNVEVIRGDKREITKF